MSTIVEIIQFLVRREAEIINKLKAEAQVWASEGSSEKRRLIRAIDPRHPNWRAYRTAKARASLLLTARHLLKLGAGDLPDRAAIRAALQAGKLAAHARLGQRPWALAMAAQRLLRKLENRHRRAPERFAEVDIWAAERLARRKDGGVA